MLVKKYIILLSVFSVFFSGLFFVTLSFSQDEATDEKIIERYKLMLIRKPKEGSTFDRLYQFYLEGSGLEAMVSDYQSEAQEKPNDPNIQLILGHIYKRLGKDEEALTAYQRAVELSQNDYYAHFALGQLYVILRHHEDAISELTKATSLSEQAQTISPEELTDIYKTLGHAYFSRDMLDEAIKAWEKISELDPDDIFARIELADLFREQELYTQAIAQYEEIIKLKKDDTYRKCLSMREIGKIHEESGEYQKALQQYDAALDLTAQGNWLRKDLQHRIIAIYSADANWKDLIAYYDVKLETNPNDPETLGLLAAAYIENQQLEEGIDTYKKGLALAPTDTGLRLSLIGALRDAEKFEDAAVEYETLSEQHPDDIGIYRELGKLYLQLENEEQAKGVYQRLIDRDPKSANIYITLAEIYTGHEWLEDAVAAYQKATELDTDNLDYIEYYGDFYYRQGESPKAIETWNRMVVDTKSTAENYDRLARLLETKKFSDEAIDASRKAVELMPATYRFRESLAKRLMNNELYVEALVEYTEAMKLAPNAFFAEQMDDKRIELYKRQGTLVKRIEEIETELDTPELADNDKFAQQKRLAKMYLKLGNTAYALEILLDAKKLRPDDINVNRWAANIYVKQGRRDEAINIYRHLTNIDNTNAREYYSNIAKIYLETLDFEKAKEAAKQVVAHSPRNPEGHHLLAQIAMQSGDYDTSVDSFKQAIRLRPEAIDIRSELAQLYHNSGDFRLAIAQYWRCWNLSDNISDKLSFIQPLGEAYYSLGRRTELAERLKQMAKSQMAISQTSGIASVLALAQVYRNEGDLSSARFQLARALDQRRENPELLYQLVGISLDLGDIEEALSYQQQLVKADPDPIHQQKLGELLFDVGREQEAVQTWSKVLHQKKHTLDAEIRLAKLLIRHGLMEEAFFALDNAAEKITGADAYIGLYQIGATLVEISEPEKALPYFQQIVEMSKPAQGTGFATTKKKSRTTNTNPNSFYGPPGTNIYKLHLASILSQRVQPQQYSSRNVSPWVPTTFEEAQAAALVQVKSIMDDLGQLDDMFAQYEEKVTANPKDIQTLELLAQLYILMKNQEKTDEVLDKLLTASPDNLVYQGIKLGLLVDQEGFQYDSFINYLDKMTGLTLDGKNWYLLEFASIFLSQGKRDSAEKMLDELDGMNVLQLSNGHRLMDLLVRMGRIEQAEEMLSELPTTTGARTSQQYTRIYETVSNTYLSNGDPDKAIEYFWKYIEKTNPTVSNTRYVASLTYSTYSSSQTYQTNFPSPTSYYTQTRLDFLQKFFNKIWIKEQQELFYTVLEDKYNGSEGRNRIYPALAISYCKWWDGKRDKSLEVLNKLQEEFPDDLSLKMNTIFVSIQSGKYNVALDVVKELIHSDPKNLNQYYDLTLQIAMYTGDSSVVRDLMKNILNSPTSVQQLHNFSQKLQSVGFTQYAVAVSQKAMDLVLRERDPSFLRKFSTHLNDLGRGQDAARLTQRAAKLENLKVLSGQTLPNMNIRSVTLSPKRLKMIQDREAKLVKIVEQNPKSFKAQSNLAAFYSSRNQVQKAIQTYQAALELRPNDSTLRNQFADMLRRVGEAKKAVEQYTYLLKNNISTSQYSYYQYGYIIETFIQAGEIKKLISIAKEMVGNNQGSGRSNEFVRRIAQHFRNNNNNVIPLIEIYEKSLESGSETHFYDLVSAYMSTGNRDKARQLLVGKLKTGPAERQVNVVLRLSNLDEGLDDLKNLAKEYEEKFPMDTAESSMLYLLTILKIATNDLEGSDIYVEKLLKNKSNNIGSYWLHTIANAYQDKGDSDRQQRMLEAAIEIVDLNNTGQLSNTYQSLGKIYADKGEKEKAKKAIRKMGNLRLMRSGGARFYDKDTVARTYMDHGLYDEAEVLLIEIINDLSAHSYYRERAQEQLVTIRVRRGGTDNRLENTMDDMNIALLRTKAQEEKGRGNYYEAIRIYEQIVKKSPDDLGSRAELASLYTLQNEQDKAIEMWDALLKVDPANTKYQDGLVDAYKVANRIDDAIEFAQGYIQENPDTGLHHTRLADLYAFNGQIDTAITTYKKAIELSPSDAKSHEELAKLYEKNRNYDAAEKSYNDALKFSAPGSNQAKVRQSLMKIYQRQGKLEEILKQAEEQGTLTFDMQQERARIYQNNGDMEKAASAYQKALGMTADKYARGDIQRQLISIHSKLGKLEEYLKETEKQGMVSFEMQREIARLYQNKREYDKAAAAYKKAAQMTTQSYERRELERQMMQLYRQSGKFEQFLKDMEKDGTLSADMQVELAKYYSSRGKSEKAIEAYQKANNMTDSDQEEISNLMMNEFVKLDKTDKAIEIYESLVSNSSESQSISYYSGSSGFRIQSEKEQARESLINVFKRNRKLNELEKIYSTKLEKEPNDTDILTVLAEIHRNSKNYEKAAEVYQNLCKIEPENVRNYFYAAASLEKIGQKEQSQALIEQGNNALSSRPDNKDSMLLCTLGSICYESKMYEPAITLFKEAAKVNELTGINSNIRWQQENIYEILGKSYMETKQYEEAVEAYQHKLKLTTHDHSRERIEKAIKQAYDAGNLHEKHIPEQLEKVQQNPNDVNARITLAESYVSSERYDEAIVQFEKISELQPNSPKWHKTVGDLYGKTKQTNNTEWLQKAATAYEKAIALDPNSYEFYDTLAKLYAENGDSTKAEAVYIRALNASHNPDEHDKVVNAILDLDKSYRELDKRLEKLEEINTKKHHSTLLHKLLGDTYLASGDTEKASVSYKKWLEIVKKESEKGKRAMALYQFAEHLLDTNKLPEIALEAAKHATQARSDATYFSTLGNAYLVNEQFENAFEQFERSFNLMNQSGGLRGNKLEPLLRRISQAIENMQDKSRYQELMGKLIDSIPTDVDTELETILLLADFCRKLNLTDKAKAFVQKTGFFPQTAWLILGPFDNANGVGYSTAFIPEEQTQIDKTAEYDGVTGKIKWVKSSDEIFDGFSDFGMYEQFYAAYAWISFTSPEEREAEIRFDSDDQGKVYLNGKKVYAHRRTRGATIDRRTIPVTLAAGENTILVKVCNESLPWGFYLRITDTDGNPFDDLKVVDTE